MTTSFKRFAGALGRRLARFAFILTLSAAPLGAADSAPRPLDILFSGFVEGTFGPCGCKTGPNGGLARRAGFAALESKRSDAVQLQVDLGNYFKPLGPNSRAINEMMLDGMRRLPIRVFNLAPGDLHKWSDLAEADLGPTRVISTNLTPRDPSTPTPERYAIVEIPASDLGIADNLRIGFLGVSDPARVKPNSGFKGAEPAAAVARVAGELADKTDFLVLLADVPRNLGPLSADSELRRIAEENPNLYAILTTESRYVFHPPEQVNNAVILSSVERGRHLGQLRLTLGPDGGVESVEPRLIDLKQGTPEDPELLKAQLELERRLP